MSNRLRNLHWKALEGLHMVVRRMIPAYVHTLACFITYLLLPLRNPPVGSPFARPYTATKMKLVKIWLFSWAASLIFFLQLPFYRQLWQESEMHAEISATLYAEAARAARVVRSETSFEIQINRRPADDRPTVW